MAVLAIRDATGRISFYSICNNKQIYNILEPFNQGITMCLENTQNAQSKISLKSFFSAEKSQSTKHNLFCDDQMIVNGYSYKARISL